MSNWTVPEMLRNAAAIYEERNKVYGDNYKLFGHVMMAMLGQVDLRTPEDHNRFGILVQMVSKLTRYANNFAEGGHEDSLNDLAVYTLMLQELDQDLRNAALPHITLSKAEEFWGNR